MPAWHLRTTWRLYAHDFNHSRRHSINRGRVGESDYWGSAPQSSERPTKTFTPAPEVAALIAKAKSDHKEGQPTVTEPMLELGSYDGHMEYRPSVGPAAVHEKEAEIFYVIDGSGIMVTGGKLVKEKRTDATNLTGSAIEGGTARNIAKGDFILVPENTPHWFSSIEWCSHPILSTCAALVTIKRGFLVVISNS